MENTNFEALVRQALADQGQNSSNLAKKIILAIERRKRNAVILRLTVFGILALCTTVAGVFSWNTEVGAIGNSGASEMLSLLFTDFGTIIGFWREYLSSLVSAIPFVSVAIIGALIWAGLMSVYELVKNSIFLINNFHQYEKY